MKNSKVLFLVSAVFLFPAFAGLMFPAGSSFAAKRLQKRVPQSPKAAATPQPAPVAEAPKHRAQPAQARLKKSIGIGLTDLTYSQTGVDEFKEKLLTLKGGLEMQIPNSAWSIGGGFFFNAFELSNTGIYQLKILGVNLRAGTFLTPHESAVHVKFNGGLYYNTSISEIGFKNVIGPQIYPEIIFRMGGRSSVMIYGKYSPVLVAGSFNMIRNREIATGIYFRQAFGDGKSFLAGIDYAGLDASVGAEEAKARSLSFGIGLGF
jgi:hypothetical protein